MNSPNCKYHPTEFASWYCPNCKVHSCINCVNDPRGDLFPSCTLCRKTLTSLSLKPIQPNIKAGNLLNPILQIKSLLSIFIASISLTVVSNSDLSTWIKALLFGFILVPIMALNFSFLEKIANNEPASHNFRLLAKSENLDVLVKFLVYMLLVTTLITKLVATSSIVAQVIAACLIFGVPSSLIIIMMEKNIFASFNPLKIFAIVKIFSVDYLAIFACWLGGGAFFTMPTLIFNQEAGLFFIQAAVIYGFAIFLLQLAFRLMGAVVFKNHVELNYSVRSARRSLLKTIKQVTMVEIDIYIQEGRFEDAIKCLWKLVDEHNSYSAYEKLISIYHFKGNKVFIQKIAQQYFDVLEKSRMYQRAAEYYLQLQEKGIGFRPKSEKLALAMVAQMRKPTQAKDAISLLTQYEYRPNASNHWDKIAYCLAQLEFEYNQDRIRALELINMILKRSVDQDILECATKYKLVIDSH